MSFYYKPEWCLYAASEVERNQAAKKRFVDEYESNVCYRKEAKNLLNDKIMGLTEVVPSRRADTVKVAAVMSYLQAKMDKTCTAVGARFFLYASNGKCNVRRYEGSIRFHR